MTILGTGGTGFICCNFVRDWLALRNEPAVNRDLQTCAGNLTTLRDDPQHVFGKWIGVELDADSHRLLWILPGFAHGFLVRSDCVDFRYKTADYYAPQRERAVKRDDRTIGITWPLTPGVVPAVSAKDAAAPALAGAEAFAESSM